MSSKFFRTLYINLMRKHSWYYSFIFDVLFDFTSYIIKYVYVLFYTTLRAKARAPKRFKPLHRDCPMDCPLEGARFMRKVGAQHRSHEMRARLDHGASNTGILNIISWSKGTLLTSGVQAERKGYRLPHLLRRSNISCPCVPSFLSPFFLFARQ